MRYDTDHKQKTREKVLEAAAEALRADGPHKLGVAGVMAKAGLTHGGFYAHFESKDDLVAQAIGHMFARSRLKRIDLDEGRGPAEKLVAFIDYYLSQAHRDSPIGCPMPALAADAPRLTPEVRAVFSKGMAGMTGRIAELLHELGRAEPEDLATSTVAEMVGGLVLARAEPDAARSDLMLERSKHVLKQRLNLESMP
jgi:TetR/AcrR family transcriptional repressor of nem operon